MPSMMERYLAEGREELEKRRVATTRFWSL
jgi:hypothetical protein